MAQAKREFGVVGLGRMGGGLAAQALERGMRVIGHDSHATPETLRSAGLHAASDLGALARELERPRAVFLYVPAGPPIDALVDQLSSLLEPGDVIVDGGNSYWGDSIRRHDRLAAERGIELLDLGTSGGVSGARNGACFMLGGTRPAVERVEPLLLELAVPGGYCHAGPPGAGHYAKLVHNGIEFGMLQAIGEGVNLLERFPRQVALPQVLECWRNGSVIRSWLVDLMHAAYVEEGGLEHIPSYVEDTGEVNWLVADALAMEVPIPVISQAVMQLFASRDANKSWARAIAMMRHGFGGHPYGPSQPIADERRTGQVWGTFKDDL